MDKEAIYNKNVSSSHPKRKKKERKTEYSFKEYEEYFQKELQLHKGAIKYQPKLLYETFKRIVDILFCIVVAIPTILLVFIFSILIMIDSKGNPIFSQVRVGKNGKLIKIHKLRSMKIDAEKDGQKWAEEDDPRITKVGKIIRKYRIDELPQLYNVFMGRMSLIGPRPEIPSLTLQFNDDNPGFVTRLLVKPGLSGYAQVYGGYEITPREKWIKDIEYIENRSIILYIHIFFMTIKTVFTGNGAR